MSNQENTTQNFDIPDYFAPYYDVKEEKTMYRVEGFNGISSIEEMEAAIATSISEAREAKGWLRKDMATLMGLSPQFYGRYERNESSLNVGRFLVLCEQLGVMPLELLFTAAPHLWGKDQDEAELNLKLARNMVNIPRELKLQLLGIVSKLVDEK